MEHRAQEETLDGSPESMTPLWNISRGPVLTEEEVNSSEGAADRLLLSNPELVTCVSPVASSCFGLETGLDALLAFQNLRKLELPSILQENSFLVLRRLRRFLHLEDLELRSIDISRSTCPQMVESGANEVQPFCDFSKLKRLVLNDVKVDDLFFAWLAEAMNLECLELKDMNYEGSLESLKNLISLHHLELTGHFECIANVFTLTSCFPRLKDLSVQVGAPDEEDLRLLSKCHADVHLKVRRCYHPGQISALCEIGNLKSLTLSSPFGFKIPRKFKDLKRFTCLCFVDEGDAFNEIEGFENVPRSLSSLSLDLSCPKVSRLSRVLSGLATQLTGLSLTHKVISKTLGLDQFENLESSKLCAKEGFDIDVYETLNGMTKLRHLAIEGCMNIEDGLSSLVQHLDLHSFSIGGGMITSEGLRMISQLQNLKELTFRFCFFASSDFDCFSSLFSLTCLIIEYPIGLDQFTFNRVSGPHSRFICGFQLRLTSGSLN